MKLEVNVEQKHIDNGSGDEVDRIEKCAIAIALKDQGYDYACVWDRSVYSDYSEMTVEIEEDETSRRWVGDLGEEGTDWIQGFDAGMTMDPITLELEMTEVGS